MTRANNRFQFINDSLKGRLDSGRLRTLVPVEHTIGSRVNRDSKSYINFSSNDYLGLTGSAEVRSGVRSYVDLYGSGSGASRLITGTGNYHEQFEQDLAAWLDVESVLLFNSGYQLNSSIIPALADRGTFIYSDRLNHHSLVQGVTASRATLRRYKHLDYDHLYKYLAEDKPDTRKIIVSESVFSMDGDQADIHKLAALADEFDAILIIDEAHAIGVMGEQGKGIGRGIERVDISIGTFGKAFGSFGAYVATSKQITDYLVNFCGGFIYTTALPPAVIGATHAALNRIKSMDNERKQLVEMSDWFRAQLKSAGFDTFGSTSHIVPVLIGDEHTSIQISETLKENGYWVNAIRPPTVEVGTSRLRFTLNIHHRREDLSGCIEIIQKSVSSNP